jgi:hypothetical protein
LLLLNLTGANWAAMGDAERTKDRQKDRQKVGSDVLGAQMEMHSSLIAFLSLLFSSFTLLLFSIFIL